MGKKVCFLGVLDATAEGSIADKPFLWRSKYRLKYFINYFSWNVVSFFREPNRTKISVIRRKLNGLERRMRGMDDKIENIQHVSKGKKNELPKYLRKVHRANHHANKNYIIGPYKGTIHLYKAKKQTFYIPEPENYGWGKVAKGGVIVHEIPGEHSNTFAPPNDKYFADILQKSLDQSRNN